MKKHNEENFIEHNSFICPECKKEVYVEKDNDMTDGQESEWLAGWRLCPECGAYEQIEEAFEGEVIEIKEEGGK